MDETEDPSRPVIRGHECAREMYAMKSTFITLAIEDGADPEILEHRVTHTRSKRSAFDRNHHRADVRIGARERAY